MGNRVKFLGISDELQKMLDADMDNVHARRCAREAFKHIQLSIDHILFKVPHAGLKMEESYEVNSRGLEIFSKSWLPETRPKAVVYFCHGYGDTCTFFGEGIARKLASFGYGVIAMDYPGFGLSEGLHGYIPSFDKLVDDVVEHYSKAKEKPEFCNLPSFLFGESMGGAIALKVHQKQPNSWNGGVLVAPMCKVYLWKCLSILTDASDSYRVITDNVVPSWLLTQILIGVAKFLPTQKLVPTQDLGELAVRDAKKKEHTAYNVISYKHKPRLQTALELLNATKEIEGLLEKVSLPLLILHGKSDLVTDPSVSKALYERSISSDKKLFLYEDACHALLEGESDEMILRVFGDIISWLDEHTISS
ncbi:hypothetical protein H5410_008826 [Solanum commersonii]|uniref:Serine aminopeptidase S33 domain-containing protein n=1 Tax=Solanum commersonii TaxID=4109 RepID=A0A9J6AGA5_SOLCO|nr:hypothetical protein H5410_008826 [Solanum commersonii]